MSTFQQLQESITQQLIASARAELRARFRSLSGYEKVVACQRKLLDLMSKPDELRTAVFPADVQQLLVNKEEVLSEQQTRSSILDRRNLCNIQRQTEADGEDCGGSKSDSSEPENAQQAVGRVCGSSNSHSQPGTDEKDSEPESDDRDQKHYRSKRGNTQEDLSCSLCGIIFDYRQDLSYHLKNHVEEKPFGCTICAKNTQSTYLKQHLLTHSGEKPHSCSICNKRFRWKHQISNHSCTKQQRNRRPNKNSKTVTCLKCGEVFPDKPLLMRHMTIHWFTCTVCGMQVQFISQLKVHMRKHTGEKPYSCGICGKNFSQRGITKQHMLIHEREKPFGCNVCDKRFFWHFQVNRHKCRAKSLQQDRRSQLIRKPTDYSESEADSDSEFWKKTRQHPSCVTYQRNKKCPFSDIGYNTNKKPPDKDVTNEPKSVEGINSDFCKQMSPSLKNQKNEEVSNAGCSNDKKLDRSVDNHTLNLSMCIRDEKLLSCLFCGKEFSTGGHLTKHISVHTGEKLLSCIICGKTFTTEFQLIKHDCINESSHQTEDQTTANKVFSCYQCGERFARREDLNFHFKHHTSCSVCNTVFSDRDSLVQHMRSHTRQTQFSCLVCGKDFAWRRHLTRHMELHQNGNADRGFLTSDSQLSGLTATRKSLFRCLACNVGFPNRASLEQHTRSHKGQRQVRYTVCSKDKKFYHCRVCCRRFTCQNKFSQHQRLHHSQSEEDREAAEQMETADGENYKGPDPARSSGLDTHLQLKPQAKASKPSDPESDDSDFWTESRNPQSSSTSLKSEVFESGTECNDDRHPEYLQHHSDDSFDSDFWKETKKSQLGVSSVKHDEICQRDATHNAGRTFFSCFRCGETFHSIDLLKIHSGLHEGQTPLSFSDKQFTYREVSQHREVKKEDPEQPHIKDRV